MDSKVRLRIAVGISGSGRTLKNLLLRQLDHQGYQVVGVFSSTSEAPGLVFAREANLPVYVNPFKSDKSQEGLASPDVEIYQWLEQIGANLVALAGFVRPFPTKAGWEDKIINIHPSLLPKFGGKGMYGMRVHQAVIDAGEKFTGPTVHYVNEEYDKGAIIDQKTIPVNQNDTATSLAGRVFEAECELYPKVLQLLAKNMKT